MNFFFVLLALISSAAGSGSAFGMRIQETNRMRIRTRNTVHDTICRTDFRTQGGYSDLGLVAGCWPPLQQDSVLPKRQVS